jgi:hypothetical protein
MGKKRVQTRVEKDTRNELEEYCEDREVSQAEGLRRLIKTGLRENGYKPGGVRRVRQSPRILQVTLTAVAAGLGALVGAGL